MERASGGDQGQPRARVPPQPSVLQCSEHLGCWSHWGSAGGTQPALYRTPTSCHSPHRFLREVGKDSAHRMSSAFFDVLTFGISIGLFVFP